MNLDILRCAWQFAGRQSEAGGKAPLRYRLNFLLTAIKHYEATTKIFDNNSVVVKNLIHKRPEYFQIMMAPYMDSSWSVDERVNRLFNHFQSLGKFEGKFDFEFSEILLLCDLKSVNIDGYRIIVDKPMWFHREGLLALNIFKNDVRIYTLPFSIETAGNKIEFFIGGIQGRNIQNILDEYRMLTKLLYGIRPRDFIIEILRILGGITEISRITAVSDECRHHRHPYFGKDTTRHLPANYNEIWMDRGGSRLSHNTFEIPLHSIRDIDVVATKKRSMYKKRYELLFQIEHEIKSNFPALKPTPAFDAK